MAHLRMSESAIGGEWRGSLHLPLASSIAGLIRVSTPVAIGLPRLLAWLLFLAANVAAWSAVFDSFPPGETVGSATQDRRSGLLGLRQIDAGGGHRRAARPAADRHRRGLLDHGLGASTTRGGPPLAGRAGRRRRLGHRRQLRWRPRPAVGAGGPRRLAGLSPGRSALAGGAAQPRLVAQPRAGLGRLAHDPAQGLDRCAPYAAQTCAETPRLSGHASRHPDARG